MNDELKNLTEEELTKRIEDSAWSASASRLGSLNNRYLNERERRKEQAKSDIEQKRFEDIKNLLVSINNKRVLSVIIAYLVAVAIGVSINIATPFLCSWLHCPTH